MPKKPDPLTRAVVAELSNTELIQELASRGVTTTPPENLLTGKATCPKCGHHGKIEADFGTRVMRGSVWPQSWCRLCRGGKDLKALRAAGWAP